MQRQKSAMECQSVAGRDMRAMMFERYMRTVVGRTGSLKGGRLEQHKARVEKLLHIAEGGADMLHNITKPRPWRGGAQVIADVSVDAQPLKRVGEETRMERPMTS